MALNASQRAARAKRLGSSDAAAVLGLDPFCTALDVYQEKVGAVEPWDGDEHTDRGTFLEPGLRAWASKILGKQFCGGRMFIHPSDHLLANLDACDRADNPIEGQEIKTTALTEGWGDPFTDQVPEKVHVQVAHQFACVPSLRVMWVPVLMPAYRGFRFNIYRIERNPELVAAVEAAGLKFMLEYVDKRVPPPETFLSIDVAKRLRREPKKTIVMNAAPVEWWREKRQARLDAEKAEEEALSRILTGLGDAEAAETEIGTFTYCEQSGGKHVDSRRLMLEYPEVYAAVAVERRYRVPRLKVPKVKPQPQKAMAVAAQ
jgi:putative phage-type endonuclease